MKFTYDPHSIKYMKTENGDVSLITVATGQNLVLNKTSLEVLSLLPSATCANDIVEDLRHRYSQISKEVLEFDISEILRIFELYNIITVRDTNINNGMDEYHTGPQYIVAGDINYKKVSQFIQSTYNGFSVKRYNENDKAYYTPINLRYRVMNNKEYGVFTEIDNNVKGYLTIVLPSDGVSAVVTINDIFFCEGLLATEMSAYLMGMLHRILKPITLNRQINKIRVALVDRNDLGILDTELLGLLTSIGFVLECILYNETTDGNVHFYIRTLS